MSRIDDLISQYCSEGVKNNELRNLLDYTQPTKFIVKSTMYNDTYNTPVLTAGGSFILGYTTETDGIYNASKDMPVIIFDDFTTSFHWVDFSFKVKSSAMKMLTPKKGINFRYVYHAMKNISYKPSSHARQWISTYSNFKIPIPPLAVQREIVKILDTFTELEKELEIRQQQYAHYRDALLDFDENEIEYKQLEKIATIKHGKDYRKLSKGDIPVYGSGGLVTYVNEYLYNKPSVLIPRKGTITNIFYLDTPFWNLDTVYYTEIDITKVIPKFFYYFMKKINLLSLDTGSGRPSLTRQILNRIKIPVPPLEVQREIVAILDKFDALINDLSSGLPAEITARRQQYAHYRDKLLTFKEAV